MDKAQLVDIIRQRIKASAPTSALQFLRFMRAQFRRPPIDDVVLAHFTAVRDESDQPRLNLVMPRLAAGTDFGGMATGIDLFFRFLELARETTPFDVRLIITDVIAETDPGIVTRRANKFGVVFDDTNTVEISGQIADIPVRRRDVFYTYNWWTTLNINQLVAQQAQAFRGKRLPIIYLIQDYEAMFLEFSSAHLLAREALDAVPRLWTIVNSSNLQQFIEVMGHRTERSFVFDPVISEALRPYTGKVDTSVREKVILVYGRPTVERNCFPALVRGLRRWARDYPQYGDWKVVSAGTEHAPVPLGDGRDMRSVGKLSLDDYADTLLRSSVGVSLMASPHPSYPPLEMAHFGMRTVTNGYLCKDLSTYHPNITSVSSIGEDALAGAIAQACSRHGEPTAAEPNPDYLRDDHYPFLDELVARVAAALA